MSKQPPQQGRGGKEKTGAAATASGRAATTASSASQPTAAAATAGRKRPSSDALAGDSSPCPTDVALQGRSSKKTMGEQAATSSAEAASNPAASSSHAAAAASSSASSWHTPELQPSRLSFFSPVQTLLEALLPILTRLHSLRRAIGDPLEAATVVQLQEKREELQQRGGAPQSEHRIQQLQDNIRVGEDWLAGKESQRRAEERDLQDLRSQLTRREGEQPAGQLVILLADNALACRWARDALLTGQIPWDVLEMQRRWLARACAVLEQLAASLTADEIRSNPLDVISLYARVGSLPAVDRMLEQSGSDCVFKFGSTPYLSVLAAEPGQHVISLTPLLHFFRRGLDPTLVCCEYPQSALQLACSHVQTHPLPPEMNSASALQSLMHSFERLENEGWLPNLAVEQITQHTAATWARENQRRDELHTRFMHALVSAWRAHSLKVRTLLLEAAPDQLIPDLANICAEYLDLEPAEKRRQ